MKILSHINKVRFIIEENKKYYLISLPKKQCFKIDSPDQIYRQGYWTKYNNDIDNDKIKVLKEILKTF